uniref:Putative microsomal triglyceride transfer protein n=1 Tax=Phlebotomus kandelakii TaxID=1109342 RepID=A0A6B2EAW6_9DIPT
MNILTVFTALLAIFTGQACGKVFPVGVQFEYAVKNTVVINDLNAGEYNSSVEVRADLRVTKIWELEKKKLLALTLLSPVVHRSDKHFTLPQSADEKFLVEFNEEGTNIYLSKSDSVSMRNFKRGLASLLQFFPEDSRKTEVDVTGECSLSYDELTDRKFVKRKIKCTTDENTHQRKESSLGVVVPNARNTEYHLDVAGSIENIENIEFFRISLAGNKEIGATVDSRISLKLVSQKDVQKELKSSSYSEILKEFKDLHKFQLTFERAEERSEVEKSENIIQLVKKFKNDLANDNIGTEKLSYATLKLVEAARKAKLEDLVRILNAHSTKDIRGQLLDILGAAQTTKAHMAVKKVLQFDKFDDFLHVERYLQSLAVGSEPKTEVIMDLLEVLKRDNSENDKLTESLIQTVSSMTHNFVLLDEEGEKSEVFQEVLKHLTKKIEKSTKTPRKVMFLHGLVNLKSAQTIRLLLDFVLTGQRALSVEAMKALVSMPREYFNTDHVQHFQKIYHQKLKKFDSSVRTMTVEILLDPLFYQSSVKDMIYALKLADDYEVKQFFVQRLQMDCERNAEFKEFVMQIFHADPTLNNYHVIGSKGLSTALSRKFLVAPSFNSTLISVQEIDRGVLKRGIVDMTFETETSKFSYFTIGLYADGLSSFVGGSNSDAEESSDKKEEESDPTAGMEIVVQGNYLRPLQFFKGNGELMGHVWSGTASELTPAYQATTLLHDHKEIIWLQNGLPVTIDVMGAMSLNLNGQVTISIWYRNAKSRVLQEIGFAVRGRVSINNEYAEIANEFLMLQEPKLDLVSDIDFSGDPKLCMQLAQPNFTLRLTHTKTENIQGLKRKFTHESRRKYQIPGYTHFLNRKNNEICNQIHS